MMNAGDCYAKRAGIEFRGGEPEGGVLFNSNQDEIMIINSLGIRIWKLLDAIENELSIANELKKEYEGVDVATIEEDTRKFLHQLLRGGLLECVKKQG